MAVKTAFAKVSQRSMSLGILFLGKENTSTDLVCRHRGQVQRLNRGAAGARDAFSKECGLWKPSGGDCWISVLRSV